MIIVNICFRNTS